MSKYFLITIVLLINFIALEAEKPIIPEITQFKCIVNEDICMNNMCAVKRIRNKLTLIDFFCYFPVAINRALIRMTLTKKTGGQFKKILLDEHEELCRGLSKDGYSQFIQRFLSSLQKNGMLVDGCPLLGNITLQDFTLDLSLFPPNLDSGDYRITMDITDSMRNVDILQSMFFFNLHSN